MLKQLYQKYFQKSYSFLFPLLGLKRKGEGVFAPRQTYLRLKGFYREEDHKLIVSYNNLQDNPDWDSYQQQFLLCHELLDSTFVSQEGDRIFYVFDLGHFEADLRQFQLGRYSKLSAAAKQLICSYYGVQSPEWAHIESFLYPGKAYGTYAKLLNVKEEDLRSGSGELCPMFDAGNETLLVELPDNFVEQLVIS